MPSIALSTNRSLALRGNLLVHRASARGATISDPTKPVPWFLVPRTGGAVFAMPACARAAAG
jgi:hypothetical protein